MNRIVFGYLLASGIIFLFQSYDWNHYKPPVPVNLTTEIQSRLNMAVNFNSGIGIDKMASYYVFKTGINEEFTYNHLLLYCDLHEWDEMTDYLCPDG